MATIEFRLTEHHVHPTIQVVEIVYDGLVCAVIYPAVDGAGITILSGHALDEGSRFAIGRGDPEITLRFRPGEDEIEAEGGANVKNDFLPASSGSRNPGRTGLQQPNVPTGRRKTTRVPAAPVRSKGDAT